MTLPVTKAWPAEGSPATTSPEAMPVRVARVSPRSRASSSLSWARDSRISVAARTARRASSSWTCGTPNTASAASPTNFSMMPPCRSTIVRMAPRWRASRARTDSGSRRSVRAVDPTRSQNRTVTGRRDSPCGGFEESAAPHALQYRARSGFFAPQLEHSCTVTSLGRLPRQRQPTRARRAPVAGRCPGWDSNPHALSGRRV